MPWCEQEMKFVSTLTSWFLVTSIYAPDNDKPLIAVMSSSRQVRQRERDRHEN